MLIGDEAFYRSVTRLYTAPGSPGRAFRAAQRHDAGFMAIVAEEDGRNLDGLFHGYSTRRPAVLDERREDSA